METVKYLRLPLTGANHRYYPAIKRRAGQTDEDAVGEYLLHQWWKAEHVAHPQRPNLRTYNALRGIKETSVRNALLQLYGYDESSMVEALGKVTKALEVTVSSSPESIDRKQVGVCRRLHLITFGAAPPPSLMNGDVTDFLLPAVYLAHAVGVSIDRSQIDLLYKGVVEKSVAVCYAACTGAHWKKAMFAYGAVTLNGNAIERFAILVRKLKTAIDGLNGQKLNGLTLSVYLARRLLDLSTLPPDGIVQNENTLINDDHVGSKFFIANGSTFDPNAAISCTGDVVPNMQEVSGLVGTVLANEKVPIDCALRFYRGFGQTDRGICTNIDPNPAVSVVQNALCYHVHREEVSEFIGALNTASANPNFGMTARALSSIDSAAATGIILPYLRICNLANESSLLGALGKFVKDNTFTHVYKPNANDTLFTLADKWNLLLAANVSENTRQDIKRLLKFALSNLSEYEASISKIQNSSMLPTEKTAKLTTIRGIANVFEMKAVVTQIDGILQNSSAQSQTPNVQALLDQVNALMPNGTSLRATETAYKKLVELSNEQEYKKHTSVAAAIQKKLLEMSESRKQQIDALFKAVAYQKLKEAGYSKKYEPLERGGEDSRYADLNIRTFVINNLSENRFEINPAYDKQFTGIDLSKLRNDYPGCRIFLMRPGEYPFVAIYRLVDGSNVYYLKADGEPAAVADAYKNIPNLTEYFATLDALN